MLYCEELARNNGVDTMEDAIKMLEEYHVNRDLNDGVVAALYCIAAHDTYIVPAHRREELIQISVWALTKDLPALAEQKSEANDFANWARYRLRTILRNKDAIFFKREKKQSALMVEGDRPTSDDGCLDLFSTLRAPLNTEQVVLIRSFVDMVAGLVAESAASYVVGLWRLMDPKQDVASLYHAGEFSSFRQLLSEEGVSPACVEKLMAALKKSWVSHMKEQKHVAQTASHVRAYTTRLRKTLIKHPELQK